LITTILALCSLTPAATAASREELYQSVAIVSGQDENNRQPGFRDCLDGVLVRVSGDPRLPKLPKAEGLRQRAGDFVAAFSYRDRLAGIPIHDEQGTYDRPHNLTCRYRVEVVDQLLSELGSRPWLADRPKLTIFLDVERGAQTYNVVLDNDRDQAMREAFSMSAAPLAFRVDFPTSRQASELLKKSERLRLGDLRPGEIPLNARTPVFGHLRWSDKDLGWVATWQFQTRSSAIRWTARGVNFDEAFRVAVRGVAQILSGNGNPASVNSPD
jgi:hypothetical protein